MSEVKAGDCSMQKLFMEIKKIKNMQTDANTRINEKLDTILKESLLPMKAEIAKHSSAIAQLDFDKRRKNIIIFGLEEKQGESFQDLESILLNLVCNTLELSDFSLLELDFARRLKPQPNGKPRPVLLGFTTQRRRISVLKNCGKLKGTKIHIHVDTSPEVREKEKLLQNEVMQLRRQGKHAILRRGKVIIQDNKAAPGSSGSHTQKQVTKRALSESPDETNNKRIAGSSLQFSDNSALYQTDSREFEHDVTIMETEPEYTSTPQKPKNTIGLKNQCDWEIFAGVETQLSYARCSLDSQENAQGKILLKIMEDAGFIVLNGRSPSDHEGQFTCLTHNGKSTPDTVWVNLAGIEHVADFYVSEVFLQSDHFPITALLGKRSTAKKKPKPKAPHQESKHCKAIVCTV
ncbi:hypothetical protein M8J76_015656 [Diaphorina citri]|nr:hypothetical protein M8J76_015656 [Diaphorina citri]